MTEQLEYFNRWGFLKGRDERRVIHNNGWWHKGVHVWLFNSEGELFLKQRLENAEFFPGHWEDVGEHLKPDESFEEGAVRGLEEELGVSGIKLEKVAESQMTYPENNCELLELWECVFDGAIKVNREEGENGRFFSLSEIQGMIKEREKITPWFKDLFYWYLKEGKWAKKK